MPSIAHPLLFFLYISLSHSMSFSPPAPLITQHLTLTFTFRRLSCTLHPPSHLPTNLPSLPLSFFFALSLSHIKFLFLPSRHSSFSHLSPVVLPFLLDLPISTLSSPLCSPPHHSHTISSPLPSFTYSFRPCRINCLLLLALSSPSSSHFTYLPSVYGWLASF